MLKQTFTWPSSPTTTTSLPTIDHKISCSFFIHKRTRNYFPSTIIGVLREEIERVRVRVRIPSLRPAGARRRSAGYDEDEEEEDGYNAEIGMLEAYSQSSRNEVLIVTAMVDSYEVEVIIFKGFSSCLSYTTSSDPSRSVIPARAVIKNIDRVKGPFNPSNIEYIEKGLTWETFKNRINPN